MEKFLGKYADLFYALLRIVAGYMFMLHGTQKLFGFPGQGPENLDTLMLLAGIIELVAGLLILIGLFTSIAAFIASGQMAVAYFMVHVGRQGGVESLPFPLTNGGELAVLYCFVFLYMAARGNGTLSVGSTTRRKA